MPGFPFRRSAAAQPWLKAKSALTAARQCQRYAQPMALCAPSTLKYPEYRSALSPPLSFVTDGYTE